MTKKTPPAYDRAASPYGNRDRKPMDPAALRKPARRNPAAQAAYDAEWGTDNGFAPWDNQPSAGDY